MTSKTTDLEAVKAMLLDALKGTGEFSYLAINGSRCQGAHGCHDCGVDFDADKLATTVMEFFAGREAEKKPATTLAVEITPYIDLERGIMATVTTDSVSNIIRIDQRPLPSWDDPEGGDE